MILENIPQKIFFMFSVYFFWWKNNTEKLNDISMKQLK